MRIIALVVLLACLGARAATVQDDAAGPLARWCVTNTVATPTSGSQICITGSNACVSGNCGCALKIGSGVTCGEQPPVANAFITVTVTGCNTNAINCGSVSVQCANGGGMTAPLTMPSGCCTAQFYIITACSYTPPLCTITPCLISASCASGCSGIQ